MTMKHLTLILAILLLQLAGSGAFGAVDGAMVNEGGWRQISRAARVEVAKGNFEGALSGYRAAIKVMRAQEPGNEAYLDLSINMATVNRLSGNAKGALELLDSLEPLILNSSNRLDPLLPRRYWKERAACYLALKNMDAYISCFDKAEAILKRECEPNFNRTSSTLAHHILVLNQAGKVDVAVKLLVGAAKDPSWELNTAGSRRDTFAQICSNCRTAIIEQVKVNPRQALQNVLLLSAIDIDAKSESDVWMYVCSATQQLFDDKGRTQSALKGLQALERKLMPESKDSALSLLRTRMLEVAVLSHLVDSEQINQVIARIREQVNRLSKDAPKDDDRVVRACETLAAFAPPAETRHWLHLHDKLVHSSAMKAFWAVRPDQIEACEIDNARFYFRINDFGPARQILRKYSLENMRNRPPLLVRVAIVKFTLATESARLGNLAGARREYLEVKRFVDNLPDKRSDKAELVSMTDRYSYLNPATKSEVAVQATKKVSR